MAKQPTNKEIPKIAEKHMKCNASDWVKVFLNQRTYAKMTNDEKKPFFKAAQKDKQRYENDMKKYREMFSK